MFAARVGGGVLSLIIYVVLARLLTPRDLGSYFLTVSIVTSGMVLASLGVNEAMVRFVGEYFGVNDLARVRHTTIRALQLGTLGALGGGLLYVSLGRLIAIEMFHAALMATTVGIVGAWIGLAALQRNLSSIFRSMRQFTMCALFAGPPGLIAGGVLLISLLMLLASGHRSTFHTVVWLSTASVGLASLLGMVLLTSRLPRVQPKSSASVGWATLMRVAWPLLITDVLLYVISQADLWFLGGFRSPEEVAVYAAAWRLAQLVAVPLAIANAVLPPFIAELHARREEKNLERLLRRFATWGSVPAILACLIAVLFGRNLMELCYGTFYIKGAFVLAVLSIGQTANVLAGSCGFTLMMTGNEVAMMLITGITGIMFAASEALVVRPMGIEGVACVAAATMILQNTLMLLFAKKRVGVWTGAKLFSLAPPRRVPADS